MARPQASPRRSAPLEWDDEPVSARPSNRPYSLIIGGLCAIVFVLSFTLEYLSAETPKPRASKPTAVAAVPKGEKPVPVPPVVVVPVDPEPKPVEVPKPVEPPKPKPKVEVPKPVEPPEPKKPPEVKKPVEPPKPMAVTFAKVQGIFQAKCVTCHGGDMTKNGLDLKTIASMTKGGNGGPGLKPGDADKSYIWEVINDGSMPKDGSPKLSEDEKKLIKDWINGGAK